VCSLASVATKRWDGADPPERWIELMEKVAIVQSIRQVDPNHPYHVFDGYEIRSTITGGQGLILVGRDPQLNRSVALKLWQTSGPEAEAALLAEAKILAQFSHPNVVTVYAARTFEGSVYFSMEFVAGIDGHTWMQHPHPVEEICRVFSQAGAGLAAAHEFGIQHRDFKPANLLIGEDGRVRVADFGVADTLRSVDAEPIAAVPVGTPEYMAPERLRGERGDARSDQYSFCVTLWKALHGRRPYTGKTRALLLIAIERGELVGDAEVPEWLDRLVRKGLSPDPDQRFASMEELLRALEEGSRESELTLVESPPPDRMREAEQEIRLATVRFATVTNVAAIAAVTLTMVVVVVMVLRRPDVQAPSHSEPLSSEPLRESTARPGNAVTSDHVIELIEAERLAEALSKWAAEHQRRQSLGVPVYAETVQVGEACLELARRYQAAARLADAKLAADAAVLLGELAATDFKIYAASSDPAEVRAVDTASGRRGLADTGTDLVRRATQIQAELRR
jgi:serine/threonine protein kinase